MLPKSEVQPINKQLLWEQHLVDGVNRQRLIIIQSPRYPCRYKGHHPQRHLLSMILHYEYILP